MESFLEWEFFNINIRHFRYIRELPTPRKGLWLIRILIFNKERRGKQISNLYYNENEAGIEEKRKYKLRVSCVSDKARRLKPRWLPYRMEQGSSTKFQVII